MPRAAGHAAGIGGLYFAYFAYVGLFSPYLSLYLAGIGMTIAQIGLLMAVPQVLRIVGPPFWGWLADRGGSGAGLLRISSALACASALATIQVIEDGGLDNATRLGEHAMRRLRAMADRHASIGDVRGKGLMIGVELVKDRRTKERAVELREELVRQAFLHGLLMLGCGKNSVRLTPPLNVSEAHVDEALEIFEAALNAAENS